MTTTNKHCANCGGKAITNNTMNYIRCAAYGMTTPVCRDMTIAEAIWNKRPEAEVSIAMTRAAQAVYNSETGKHLEQELAHKMLKSVVQLIGNNTPITKPYTDPVSLSPKVRGRKEHSIKYSGTLDDDY